MMHLCYGFCRYCKVILIAVYFTHINTVDEVYLVNNLCDNFVMIGAHVLNRIELGLFPYSMLIVPRMHGRKYVFLRIG